jgi:hypothetical protein
MLAAAKEQGVSVAIPRPGQMIETAPAPQWVRWWPQDVHWEKAAEAPVTSSGVAHLKAPPVLPLKVEEEAAIREDHKVANKAHRAPILEDG